jgi:hypothetical protein
VGDFDGDGYSDLMYIVKTGVAQPGYAHIFYSRGDGNFDLFTFDFVKQANAEGTYRVDGSWASVRLQSGIWVAHHDPQGANHDPNVQCGYNWIPQGRGNFSLGAAPCN